jgi:salicylate hydroxylase
MPPNATKVFRDWGILEAVKAYATVPQEVCLRAYRDGSVLHRHRLSPDTQEKFGSPHLQIHRCQLIEVLYKTALEAGAVVRFGCLVQRVEHGPTKTTVFVAGGESFQADMVVAGDGERSVLRSLILGKPNAPVPTGTLVYRLNLDPQMVLDDPELSKELKLPIMCSWLGPNAHAVMYNLDYNDMVTVAITCPDPEKDRVQLGPREASVDELKTIMAGWDPMLLRLLDVATDVRFWTLLQLPEENRVWTDNESGTMILIGDAAHSMTPYM